MNGWIKQNEPNFFKEVFQIIYVYTHIWILDSSFGKESAFNAGIPGWVPGSGRSLGEGIGYPLQYSWASLVTQLVKNLPGMKETWVQSLGREDPLEKGKGTHSSILAWRIPWTLYSMGLQRVGHDGVTFTNTVYKNIIFFLIYCLKISFMTIFFL